MIQLTISLATILITAFILGGVHGLTTKPTPIDSNIDADSKILLAKAGLTVGQCIVACETSVTAMNAFCRLVPHPAVRAACWAVTHYAGSTASVAICTGFCYRYFT